MADWYIDGVYSECVADLPDDNVEAAKEAAKRLALKVAKLNLTGWYDGYHFYVGLREWPNIEGGRTGSGPPTPAGSSYQFVWHAADNVEFVKKMP